MHVTLRLCLVQLFGLKNAQNGQLCAQFIKKNLLKKNSEQLVLQGLVVF